MTLISHPLTIERAEKNAVPGMALFAERHGWKVEKYRAEVRAHLRELLRPAQFWARMGPRRLRAFLEAGTLPGYHDENREAGDVRVLEEVLLFNRPPRSPVTYGALTDCLIDSDYGRIFFGNVALRLDTPPDTSFSVGNAGRIPQRWQGEALDPANTERVISLTADRWQRDPAEVRAIFNGCACWTPKHAASLVADPHELSWNWGEKSCVCPLSIKVGELHKSDSFIYVEGRIHAAVSLKDVRRVHFFQASEFYKELPAVGRLGVPLTKGERVRCHDE